MSEWRFVDELPEEESTVLEEIPENELPPDEPNEDKVSDDVSNKLEEIPDDIPD